MRVISMLKALLIIVFMIGGHGCTGRAPVAPAEDTLAQEIPAAGVPVSSPPSVRSKGTGIKKKAPVFVKTGDRLGWVDNALKTYPPDHFLTGLGIAPDRETARRRSLTELGKPFDQVISGRMALQRASMDKMPTWLDQEFGKVSKKCRKNSLERILSQGRVAEIFIEKASATVYALAVLDRHTCVNQLKPLIHRLDSRLGKMIYRMENADNSNQSSDKIVLLDTFICREALDAALATAMPEGKGIDPSVRPTTIVRLLNKK